MDETTLIVSGAFAVLAVAAVTTGQRLARMLIGWADRRYPR